MEPTARQLEVLQFLSAYIAEHRHGPSLREICKAIGVSGTASAKSHLDFLAKKGLVGRSDGVARGVWLTGAGQDAVRAAAAA